MPDSDEVWSRGTPPARGTLVVFCAEWQLHMYKAATDGWKVEIFYPARTSTFDEELHAVEGADVLVIDSGVDATLFAGYVFCRGRTVVLVGPSRFRRLGDAGYTCDDITSLKKILDTLKR